LSAQSAAVTSSDEYAQVTIEYVDKEKYGPYPDEYPGFEPRGRHLFSRSNCQ